MNNDDHYLWNKTGEPDPEVQQLEEILGTLRYQSRPLEIPAGLQIGRERSFFRGFAVRLAIAATIALLLLGLGLWLGLQRLQTRQRPEIVKNSGAAQPNPTAPSHEENRNSTAAVSSPAPEQKSVNEPRRHRVNQSLLAGNSSRVHNAAGNATVKNQQLTAKQLQEAAAAKEQLLLALRVASAKLNFAQRKTQDLNQREPIHNQHRIG
ncbi:MAG: hypothetical protein ABJA18_03105 [bacterium]